MEEFKMHKPTFESTKGLAPVTHLPWTSDCFGTLICDVCSVPIMYGCMCLTESRIFTKLIKRKGDLAMNEKQIYACTKLGDKGCMQINVSDCDSSAEAALVYAERQSMRLGEFVLVLTQNTKEVFKVDSRLVVAEVSLNG